MSPVQTCSLQGRGVECGRNGGAQYGKDTWVHSHLRKNGGTGVRVLYMYCILGLWEWLSPPLPYKYYYYCSGALALAVQRNPLRPPLH